MRRVLLLFFIFSFGFVSGQKHASPYHPMLDSVNIWHYVDDIAVVLPSPGYSNTRSVGNACGYPLEPSIMEYTYGDTIIDSLTYLELWDSNYWESCLVGFIREDTSKRKIYFADNLGSPEIILYDFSMQVGDSIFIRFHKQLYTWQWIADSGLYRLDSIRYINIISGMHRQFYFSCSSQCGGYGANYPSGGATLIWLEGVGNLAEFAYPYFGGAAGGGDYANCYSSRYPPGGGLQYFDEQFLSCFSHNKMVYFDNCAYSWAVDNTECFNVQDSCNYHPVCGAVNEIPNLSSFTLYPNPAANQLTLNFNVNQSAVFDIELLDMQGRETLPVLHLGRLADGVQTREMDISELAAGFYMVACKSGEGAIYRKLVVQR